MTLRSVPTVHVIDGVDALDIARLTNGLGALLASGAFDAVHALAFVERVPPGVRVRIECHFEGITTITEATGPTAEVAIERCLADLARLGGAPRDSPRVSPQPF